MTLKEHLKKSKLKQSAFAEMVGASQGHISQIISGDKAPSIALMAKIEAATKGRVKYNDWKIKYD